MYTIDFADTKVPSRVLRALHHHVAGFGDGQRVPNTVKIVSSGPGYLMVKVPFGRRKEMKPYLFDGKSYHQIDDHDKHVTVLGRDVLVHSFDGVITVSDPMCDNVLVTKGFLLSVSQSAFFSRFCILVQTKEQLDNGRCHMLAETEDGTSVTIDDMPELLMMCGQFAAAETDGKVRTYDLSKNAKPVDECKAEDFAYVAPDDGSIITFSCKRKGQFCTSVGKHFTEASVALSTLNVVTIPTKLDKVSATRQRLALAALNAQQTCLALRAAACKEADKATALAKRARAVGEEDDEDGEPSGKRHCVAH